MAKIRLIQQASLTMAFLLLAGCTTSDQIVDIGNDQKAYEITCGGLPLSEDSDCHTRASYICGDAGYTVLKEGDTPYSHSEYYWLHSTHQITVQCNGPR